MVRTIRLLNTARIWSDIQTYLDSAIILHNNTPFHTKPALPNVEAHKNKITLQLTYLKWKMHFLKHTCSKYICSHTHSEQWKLSGLIRPWRACTFWWHGNIIPITTSPGAWAPQMHSVVSRAPTWAGMPLSITRAKRRLHSRRCFCIMNGAGNKALQGCENTFYLSRGIWEVPDTVPVRNLF